MGQPVVHFEIMGGQGEELRDFYRGLFDWQIQVDERFDYGLIDPASAGIGGGIGPAHSGEARVTVYIEVPDVTAALEAVVAAGGQIAMPREDLGVTVIGLFTDPAGNLVGLTEARPHA